MLRPAMLLRPQRAFSATTDQSDDLTLVPRLSLEEFYSSVADFTISDQEAHEYMTWSAKLAMVRFKDEEEMMSFKGDFQAALAFIGKLDEVDTKGTEPLGNVLEHYGGNHDCLRDNDDLKNPEDDQLHGLDF